jgi:apolipoprotein N-acyltransferase
LSGLPALLITTALLVSAYPPNGIGSLAFVAFVPFFSLLEKQQSRRQVITCGALLGVLLASSVLYFTWMIDTAAWYQRFAASLAISGIFAIEGVVLAVPSRRLLCWAQAKNATATRRVLLRFAGAVILTGLLWAAVEWAIQKIFLGLSFHFGLTQWRYSAVVRLSAYIGLVGLSGMLASVNAAVYLVWQRFVAHEKSLWWENRVYSPVTSLIIIGVIIASATKGALRPYGVPPTLPLSVVSTSLAGTTIPVYAENEALQATKAHDPHGRYLNLILVQNGFPVSLREAAAEEFSLTLQLYDRILHQSQAGINSYRQYRAADGASVKEATTLVVWSETVLHLPMLNYPSHALSTYRLATEAQTWVLAGFPWAEDGDWYNSAILIDTSGQMQGRYSKVRPIPIAESWVTPGEGWYPLQVNDIRVGVGLCSELIDPLVARTLTKNGAEVLVYLSSLSYLGVSSAIGLHGAFAPFRAAETGRYVAQAGMVGATLIAAPDGTISAALPSFGAGTLVGSIPALNSITFYMRYGEALLGMCLIVSLVFQVAVMPQRKLVYKAKV